MPELQTETLALPAGTDTAGEAAEWPSPAVVGARLRRLRLDQGLSLRDLAARAGVSKDTLQRAERGSGLTYERLGRICAGLRTQISRLVRPDAATDQVVALDPLAERLWVCHSYERSDLSPLPDGPDLGRAAERERLVREGVERVFNALPGVRLPRARMSPNILELYGESIVRSHPGEEYVFCLKGEARVTVAGRAYRLREGEGAHFWSAEAHRYAPAETVPDTNLPVLLLSLRLDLPER